METSTLWTQQNTYKKLERFSRTKQKVRKIIWQRLRQNIPMSSKMYCCIKCSLRAPKMRKKWYSTRSSLHQKSASFTDYLGNYVPLYSCNTSRDRHRKKYLKYPRMFSCNFPHSKYKNKNHKSNCMNYKLSNDIEKNPGPFMFNIDPSKTIEAPYSQGDAIDGRRDGKNHFTEKPWLKMSFQRTFW